MKLVYVASVYSQGQASVELMQSRYEFVKEWVGFFFEQEVNSGKVLYSPIIHNHPLAISYDLPRTWDFWRKVDVATLRRADELVVLKMKGWEDSVGLQGEIDVAHNLSIPITFITVDEVEYKES